MRLSETQRLKALKASGHAGSAPVGEDIVCASATFLIRTTAQLLEAHPKIKMDGEAVREGELEFIITAFQPDLSDWLKGVTDQLLFGLHSLSVEFPDHLSLVVY
ncbi:ribosomal-processing cysteine protease Prp [Spirochaeta cellobiosiphila]|uniref:ribosomal-processing cysteine protease Prp n=1 Tax=Spirochaeta cellobiosiphila TaxID=504483 RepID=UPI00048ACD18|nr:ribosomal-processing cysteine protease Prp [Spirochaeta cellobiosiphila]